MYHILKHKLSVISIIALLLLSACAIDSEKSVVGDSDKVIIANANILTMNSEQPKAEAMAFENGKIIAVGDLESVKKVVGNDYEYYDLEGKTVVPGFIESHDHIVMYGSVLTFLDVSPFLYPSLMEALEKLKTLGKPNEDGWIYAFGADQTLYTEKRGPTLKELDEIFPDIPVVIIHLSGHGAFVNIKALKLAGVTKDTPNPQGGEFVKDENGELSSYLKGIPA